MERSDRTAAIAKLLTVASVVLAACVAAAFAHVIIDVIGDFVLTRDAYDDVAHGSRAMSAVIAAILIVICVAIALWVAVADRGRERARVRIALDAATRGAPWRFVGTVIVGALAILLAMESLDTLLQNGHLDDVADLLGGSIALALGVSVPTAVAVAIAVRRLLSALLRSCSALVVAVGSFLRRALQRVAVARFGGDARSLASTAGRPCILSSQASRRGPPSKFDRRFSAA